MTRTAELGLGTVQWGVKYGITNSTGQTQLDQVRAILDEASKCGIRVLDTASQYGEAESALGKNAVENFHIVSKTPSFGGDEITATDASLLLSTFERSLERLSCPQIYALLIHRAKDIFLPGGGKLISVMERLKEEGKVRKIGVSVYDGSQIDAILKIFRPDIVQLPLSVLDQRLLRSGHLDILKENNVEIHVRSVFLQGLLLMPLEQVPAYFEPIRPLLSRWHAAAREQGLTATQAALSYIRDLSAVDVVLVGVENVTQFKTCQADFNSAVSFDATAFACDDETYVNPMFWKVN